MALLHKSRTDSNRKEAQDLSQALDNHMDRKKRKAYLVVHNPPEQEGNSLSLSLSLKDLRT